MRGFKDRTRNYIDFKDVLRERLLISIKVIFDKDNPSYSGCWEWQYPLDKGYARFRLYNYLYYAHVVSAYCYGLINSMNDVVRGESHILHKCNNSKCINPSHLYVGTQKDNVRDAIENKKFRYWGHNKKW